MASLGATIAQPVAFTLPYLRSTETGIVFGVVLGVSVSYIFAQIRGGETQDGNSKQLETCVDNLYTELVEDGDLETSSPSVSKDGDSEPATQERSEGQNQSEETQSDEDGLLSSLPFINYITEDDEESDSESVDNGMSIEKKAKYLSNNIDSGSFTMSNDTNHQSIVQAMNKIAEDDPEIHNDKVGKLKKTLSQDSVNSETIGEHLHDVLMYARVAEKYANTGNKIEPIHPTDIDPSLDESHELVASFNHFLETINELNDTIQEKNDEIDAKEKKIQQQNLKIDELNREMQDYEELESQVESSLQRLSDSVATGIQYKNANLIGKLDMVTNKLLDGHIENSALHRSIQTVKNTDGIGTSNVSNRLLDHLHQLSKGEVSNDTDNSDKLLDIIKSIDARDTKVRRITGVDRNSVQRKALSVKEKAASQSGVATDAIEKEIENRILKVLSNSPNDEMVYATDKTLIYLESILNKTEGTFNVGDSVSELRSEITDKVEGVEWYMENRPEYDHSIPKLIKNRLDRETEEAIELATSGNSDIASGRLYMADVVYELLETMYTRQQYNSVLEAGA